MARQTLLIALGGNALIRKHQRGTIREQFANLTIPMQQIARLSQRFRVVITHGNGPQVGNLLLQQECCESVPKLPLGLGHQDLQGQLGDTVAAFLLDEKIADLGAVAMGDDDPETL